MCTNVPNLSLIEGCLENISLISEQYIMDSGEYIIFSFHQERCSLGSKRTLILMGGEIISNLFLLQGFPYGTKPGEEERVSLPNADYTKGNFQVSFSYRFVVYLTIPLVPKSSSNEI